ncbi:MAG: hypothetical protein U1E76_01690 [Planctomycetota bacterium]
MLAAARSSPSRSGALDVDRGEHGRHHVDQPHDARLALLRGHARAAEDEGHVQRRLVDQMAMGVLAVLAQALAVVGGDHHHRVLELAARAQMIEQATQLVIEECDLAIVGPGRELLAERRGWIVWRMRVVVVCPQEPRPRIGVLQPRDGAVGDLIGAPFGAHGIVAVEALVETVARRERHARNHRAGAIAGSAQHVGDRGRAFLEPEDAVVAHAVRERPQRREDRRMARQRGGHLRDRVLEQHSGARHGIDVRGGRATIAVAPEMVGARRVERDQQHRGMRARSGRRRARGRAPEQRELKNASPTIRATGHIGCGRSSKDTNNPRTAGAGRLLQPSSR